MGQYLAAGMVTRLLISGFLLVNLGLSSRVSFAMNCVLVHHPVPSEADTAYLAGDLPKATELYRAALDHTPGQQDLANGLVHSLLGQGKVIEATDTIHALIGDKPASAGLLTLRGEVELRAGKPWMAAETAAAAAKLDSCNPRTLLLFARLAGLNSRSATAQKLLAAAHSLDPEDPEIRLAWIDTLPFVQRVPELETYLSASRGDDAQAVSELRSELEQLKKWNEEPRKPCTLVSHPASSTIPLSEIRSIRGFSSFTALDLKVNDHRVRLSVDTSYNARLPVVDVSGLLILRSAADHMGLKPLFQNDIPGVGHQGPRHGYVAIADSISIGDVEYHDCAVQVMDGQYWNDADGSMSPHLLSDFLVTLDNPAHKLILQTLPLQPGNAAANGPTDRYVAPEMKDYTPIYRAGSDLVLPGAINGKLQKLFLLDTSVGLTVLSPAAAHEVATGHEDARYEVRNTDGKVDTSFSAGNIELSFAGVTQNITHIDSFDTARFSRDAGMQIAGLIGDQTIHGLTIHIDYRDGLIKIDFDPKRWNTYKP